MTGTFATSGTKFLGGLEFHSMYCTMTCVYDLCRPLQQYSCIHVDIEERKIDKAPKVTKAYRIGRGGGAGWCGLGAGLVRVGAGGPRACG